MVQGPHTIKLQIKREAERRFHRHEDYDPSFWVVLAFLAIFLALVFFGGRSGAGSILGGIVGHPFA